MFRTGFPLLFFTAAVAALNSADAATPRPPDPSIATSDIVLSINASDAGPKLTWIQSLSGTGAANLAEEPLPASVEFDGAQTPLTWKHNESLDTIEPHKIALVYESQNPHLRLVWKWEARASFGPVEHTITVKNLDTREVWLPMIDSLRLAFHAEPNIAYRHFYVEKGADKPSPQGTHLETISGGYKWTGTSSTYGDRQAGEPREIIPAEFVFSDTSWTQNWYAGIEFGGRTRISVERANNRITTALGLNPAPGPFRTRLNPGATFETPTVFLGAFSGGPDSAANQLRPWVRAVLGNQLTWRDPHYPYVVNNSWGSGMAVDEPLALRMIGESKELGVEMFHIDAGWFRGVGDWFPDPKKFPHGLAPIADEAHKQGLRFGIWVDWTQAALDTQPGALNVRDPKVANWLVNDVAPDWKPEEFKGQTIDIGVPAAGDYALKEVNRIIDDYHLDMLEHDGYLVAEGCTRSNHPHAPPNRSTMKVVHEWGGDFVTADNSTDVSYHATRAYYDIYARTRAAHPGLIFEICNDGGRMVDFGSAAHGDYFSITDSYDPLSNRRAFYDTSYMLPPAMLESYVEKWPTPRRENFLYMLRSGMMGWLTLMMDTSAWTPAQHETAKQAIALYKEKLRPLIRDAEIFHITSRPDGVHWDGIEYWDPACGEGVVYAFRGSVPNEPQHEFTLDGVDPAQKYKLHFQDASSPDRTATGRELMRGLSVNLPQPLSSELVFFSAIQ
ncbi:glycoside hydrolase family 36 protein [Occallatibacter riparius]|uniref:Alpha-galactosidase n=1 Tax=Occallatibacter riparius TaxID=1002689 RepID=A0A9J7BK67_9BACT|nr:glycoside hydrolase family 36 protein [Occallatibacter riparius]UWZ82170.1 alpha-galactosidase [Occallatibacter riparius]